MVINNVEAKMARELILVEHDRVFIVFLMYGQLGFAER